MTAIICAELTNSVNGCLLALYSETTCVVHSITRNKKVAEKCIGFLESYLFLDKCLSKRSAEMNSDIASIRADIRTVVSRVVVLGSYPIVKATTNRALQTKDDIQTQVGDINAADISRRNNLMMKKELKSFLDRSRAFLSKEARELVVVNASDMSGSVSKLPHTLLAATYLTGSSLKLIIHDCFASAIDFIEKQGVEVLNLGVDGESLHLATSLADGTPGTDLALAKEMMKRLKTFSKTDMVRLVSENLNMAIEETEHFTEDDDEANVENILSEEDLLQFAEESIHLQTKNFDGLGSLEDLEVMLRGKPVREDNLQIELRKRKCKQMKVHELRSLCLKQIFPKIKSLWLEKHYGCASLKVQLGQQVHSYTPHTVFCQNRNNLLRTITFDAAHICNLLRESAAKGKLAELGLPVESLTRLGQVPEFEYINKIIKLNNRCLEYDPMNQASSYKLFSKITEIGLRKLGDETGANCCKVLREGVIDAFDTSGVDSQSRCQKIFKLKAYLEERIDITDKLLRPGPNELTAELLQMLYCSMDSHIVSYLNIEFYNPRRKSTGTVEQFFSQITLMNDGGRKLNCEVIGDILERVTLTNALKLLPIDVKV